MKVKIALLLSLSVLGILSGCKSAPQQVKDYTRQLPPGQFALRKITDPAQIPDFTLASFNVKDLRQAVANSLNYLKKPSSQKFYPSNGISHSHAVASLQKFAQLLDSGLIGLSLNSAIKDNFDVYISVGCDDMGTVLFTGYYTPILDGSTTRTEKYKYPLYKQPADLVKAPDGKILGQRLANGEINPQYPSRETIERTNMLKGQEIVWLADQFEAYIATIQGSAQIRLPDGSLMGIGYAANNGWDYKPIAEAMISDGAITRAQLSLASMIRYFKQNPDKVSKYTNINPRYVFFQSESGPPRGSINEPVLAMRSIATDKSIFPRAALTFFSTKLPTEKGGVITQELYDGFALDQDTGGAIRAPGRCDVYIGIGDTAGKLAGQTYQEGKLYYLFLKDYTSPPAQQN